nr:uncharacterized mitochondrial protein AtMg00810-like [Tanacetum cinerariifolium]
MPSNEVPDDKDVDEVLGKGDEGVSKESGIDDQERIDSNTQDVNTAMPSIDTANTNINISSLNINIIGSNDPKPNKVIQALTDPSWIKAMREELLQFKLQKDERGIVVRNKARLVAQGYTQEEGIDYDETTSTSIEPNKALIKDVEAEDVDVHLYRLMIKSLMYLTTSRPDIMFAVCACVRFQVTPKTSHLHVVKRIFRYLKGQPKLSLWYPKDSSFDLEAFYSDYAGASLDRKSTTGGCHFLGKRLISWQCKKQTIVANSTTKAEYVAAASYYGQLL